MYNGDLLNYNVGSGRYFHIAKLVLWLLTIMLSIVALNILLAIIADSYSYAVEDEALSKERAVMLESSVLASQ